MRLVAAVGLQVAPIEPRRLSNRTFLLVERYDRETMADGGVRRLHQEDFCQALGFPPENKYAGEGGPGFKACFDLVRRACSTPAPAVLRLLDVAIFNAILGNADAHSKNFSLLYSGQTVDLAPLYDLLSTVAYPELSENFAMRIAKRATLDEFRPDTWERFADDIGVGAPFTRRRVSALAQAMSEQAPGLARSLATFGLDAAALDSFAELIKGRAERFLRV
jgi:serine/threonine-protein kinase HipA